MIDVDRARVELAPGWVLRGRVRTLAGEPAVGARVRKGSAG